MSTPQGKFRPLHYAVLLEDIGFHPDRGPRAVGGGQASAEELFEAGPVGVGDVESPAGRVCGLAQGELGDVTDVDGLDALLGRSWSDNASAPLCPLQPPWETANVLAGAQDYAGAQEDCRVPEGLRYRALSASLLETVDGGASIRTGVPVRCIGIGRTVQQWGVVGQCLMGPAFVDGHGGDVYPPLGLDLEDGGGQHYVAWREVRT